MMTTKPVLSLLAAVLATSACTTTQPRRPLPPSAQQTIEKEGQKVPGTPGETPAVPPTSVSTSDNSALWSRIHNLDLPLSEEDIRGASALFPAEPNSQNEAIFVMTQLRMLQADLVRRTSFQSQDLVTNQTADRVAGLSLQRHFQDVEIDLEYALRNNPTLKNRNTLSLAKHLAERTGDTEPYRATLLTAIAEKGQEFGDLTMPGAVPATAGEATLPPEGEPAVPAPDAGVVPGAPATDAPATVDLMGSDALLLSAQRSADKGDFKGAIDQIGRIKEDDPYHAQALEKRRQFSNRAVKDLRQKAAEAFSNAIPINDSSAKGSYLRQAKNYLEEALRDYPQADQLDTVKENLEAVNRDLSSLDKTGT